MKKLCLLMFCVALLCSEVVTAQCMVDFVTSSDQCSALPVTVNYTYAGTNNGGPCGVTYSWNFGAGATPATSTAQNPSVSYSTAGAKTVSLTVTAIGGFGCGGGSCAGGVTITKVVNIATKPNVSFTSTAPQCANAPVNFTNTATNAGQDSLTYSWDFGAGATPRISTAQNPTGIVYSSSGTKSVTFQIKNSIGCVNTVVQNITIDVTPTVSFTSTAPQCTDLNVDFTNTGTSTGVTWAWNFGAGAEPASSVLQNPAGVIYSTSGSKVVTFTITSTSPGACAVTATQTININQTPSVSFISTAPQCVNTAVGFTNTGSAGASYSYDWDFGVDAVPASSTAQNPLGVLYTSAGSKSITFKITGTNGCSNTVVQNIAIDTTPVVSFTSTAPQCTNVPIDFTVTGTTANTSFLWDFGLSAAPATSGAQNATGVFYSTAGVKTVSLTETDMTSGCAVTVTQTISINQTPTASFTTNAPKCVEKPVAFINTGSTGGFAAPGSTGGQWSYSWDFGSDASPRSSSSENPSGVTYSAGGNKLVTHTVYNQYCTKTDTQTVVTIYALPLADAGKDTIICASTSVKIGTVAVGSNTYSWFAASTLDSANIAQPVATPVAPNTQYIVTVTDPVTTCVNKDTINVTMLDPLVADAGGDVVICRYDSVQIGTSIVKGQRYLWSLVAGLSDATLSNPLASPDSTTIYKVTVTGDFLTTGVSCPSITDEVMVTVHQLPTAKAGPDDTITVGSNTQLVATGGLQYLWRPSYGLDNIGINTPIANPEFTTEYIVQVIDIYGCEKEDSVTITVIKPSLWVPTAFTPNGDGKSDVFIIRGEGINDFEFGVFNRWGEQIFYTKDMAIGWDGNRIITGERLPAGAYVYYVKGVKTDGEAVNMKGMVNLIR
jgi:gliding motility-associated-like protein